MTICLKCGKENDGCLCNTCRSMVNIEDLCRQIIEYRPGNGENQLWDQKASELNNPGNFRNVVFALAEEFPSPRKEYWQIMSFAGTGANVQKNIRPWLYETNGKMAAMSGLTPFEKNRIKGMVLGALFMDYRYEEADLVAGELLESGNLPTQAYYNLIDFYSKTRRYDEADDAVAAATELYGKETTTTLFRDLVNQNQKYREAEVNGKKEYMPNPKENKEEARKSYVDFLDSIGIEAEIPVAALSKRKIPQAIPRDQYPLPEEIRDPHFDSFVAYDLETTGFSPKTDAIIEIGAVKVSGGRIIESKEFLFQEFVRPYKKGIREEVTQLTGITKEDVKNARQMWEVFPDFMEFAGDNVLVGFNNVKFDSQFLVRAGRYSRIEMGNPQFDVMKYADGFRDRLELPDSGVSLERLSEELGIENPRAHRALADALTTARVFLKLREMDTDERKIEVDDLLADIDDW